MTEIYLHIVARMNGRLIVHAPVQWLAEESTESKPREEARIIPHKRNRAVVFNSNLIHQSDVVALGAPAFEHRRMNLTMLFGERERHHRVTAAANPPTGAFPYNRSCAHRT
eukprot:COSAG05_NODE_988_length_6284_cov_7.662571_5_plen_111_part_00